MSIEIIQVDAFTNKPFAGNPAAVCLLPEPRSEDWMQSVAMEMNLSETAFLVRQEDGFNLRWFTPVVEVDLCGHATLASSHVLWEDGILKPDEEARFHTKSGLLTARRNADWIELDFPAIPLEEAPPPENLVEALGASPVFVGKSRIYYYLIEVESEEEVRGLSPDFAALRDPSVFGIIVTSLSSSPDFDFVSRFFAPGGGIDEDPVTGSAHCCLGPYWKGRLDKDVFIAYQASARGGVVRVNVKGERVLLGGQAVTVMRGKFILSH
jgi:PhzF family phenazine biosynthesis protein